MQKPNAIHFVGIKGVGMAPLAIIAREAGIEVSGSDIAQGFITDSILQKAEITPFVGFDPLHVRNVDLVITTGAHAGFDNVEVVFAKKMGIPVITQGQAVGEFMKGAILGVKDVRGISVTGTHGKTTTTAMIASIFNHASYDPSWVIGTSEIPTLGMSGHFGKGEYFIAEADEYATEPNHDKTTKFMWQHPFIAVFTNIEHDHPDLYPTLDSVREAFLKFSYQVDPKGWLVANGDDPQIQKLLQNFDGQVVTFGYSQKNTYQIKDLVLATNQTTWNIVNKKEHISLCLSIPGEHNALNATAAFLVAYLCDLPKDIIIESLQSFSGTKRRMEYIGQLTKGAILYDDYAHHPTEIQKTLKAFREKYPNKKIVCIFQPHTYSRTKLLFEEFISSFKDCDEVIFTKIYPSQREIADQSVSASQLKEGLTRNGQDAVFKENLSDVVQYLHDKDYGEDTIVITMGAGDIYQIANLLLEE